MVFKTHEFYDPVNDIQKGYGTVSMQVLSWNLYSGWYNSLHVPSVVTVQIEMGVRGLNLEIISASHRRLFNFDVKKKPSPKPYLLNLSPLLLPSPCIN